MHVKTTKKYPQKGPWGFRFLKESTISIDLNKLHEIYYSDHSAITFFINNI